MLQTIFFICFGVGVGFVVISFIVGEFTGSFEGDSALSFLRPSIAATFLVIFGGVGLLLEMRGLGMLAVGLAFFAGFFMALLVHRFVIIPLRRLESTSAVDRQMLVGREATVIERIPQGQYGKITFTVNGNKHNAPAKSEDGNEILRHSAAEIIYIEKNTYYVRRKGV